jgi:hypothetical protein
MTKAGAAHHREPLSGHRAKTPLATFGHTLREAPLHGQKGATPPTGHLPPDRLPTGEAKLWPLATHHRVPLSGQKGSPTYGPTGEAGLRRLATYAHRPPLAREGDGQSHPPPAPYWPQRGGLRREAFAPPLTDQTGRPTLATLPPFGRPTGAYSHRLPHWPPTGPLLAIRGGLPLAKGEAPTGQRDGRGSLWPHGSSSPPTSRPPMAKGEPPPSLASHWPPTGHKGAGRGRLRPALPRLAT